MSKPAVTNSEPKRTIAPRLTPDEKQSVLKLVARGFRPSDVVKKLRSEIPHLKAHVVRDCAKRNPALLREVSESVSLAETEKQIKAEALKGSIPEIVEATRKELIAKLPAMMAREIESLMTDQDLLETVSTDVKSPTDASAFMRARLLLQQRRDNTYGVPPVRAAEELRNAGPALHLHAHGWGLPPVVKSAKGVGTESSIETVEENGSE